jgi:hypothetical protein
MLHKTDRIAETDGQREPVLAKPEDKGIATRRDPTRSRTSFRVGVCQEITRTSLIVFVLYWCWCLTVTSSAASTPCRPSWTSG